MSGEISFIRVLSFLVICRLLVIADAMLVLCWALDREMRVTRCDSEYSVALGLPIVATLTVWSLCARLFAKIVVNRSAPPPVNESIKNRILNRVSISNVVLVTGSFSSSSFYFFRL